MAKTILYLVDAKKAVRFWSIESLDDGYVVEWGVVGSPNVQEEFTEVPWGKVNRSLEEQIESEVASKIKKRKEKGYVDTIAEAQKRGGRGLNELGLPRPMLAQPFKKVKADFSDWFHQPKLDGHRCLIDLDGKQAYSRNGKPITAIFEILDELSTIDSGYVLDGELYYHGAPLQTISSWVKRRQDQTELLEYWVYDIAHSEMCYADRHKLLQELFDRRALRQVRLCPTARGLSDASETLAMYRGDKYEGAILRDPNALYEPAKRSKGLVKVKAWDDDEFTVWDITESKDGWAILHCLSKSGKAFTVTAPGDVPTKIDTFQNAVKFIGEDVRVEYANLTPDGVPFHPVATMWRNKEDE